jgi:hypothetical protein
VRFHFFTAANMKMAVFWFVLQCSQKFTDFFQKWFLPPSGLTHRPDGGSRRLWNVGELLPDFTAEQPRRQPSSYVIRFNHAVHRIACAETSLQVTDPSSNSFAFFNDVSVPEVLQRRMIMNVKDELKVKLKEVVGFEVLTALQPRRQPS